MNLLVHLVRFYPIRINNVTQSYSAQQEKFRYQRSEREQTHSQTRRILKPFSFAAAALTGTYSNDEKWKETELHLHGQPVINPQPTIIESIEERQPSVFIRICSEVVDQTILGTFSSIASFLLGAILGFTGHTTYSALGNIFIGISYLFKDIIFWRGQSIGRWLFETKVIKEDGSEFSWMDAVTRNFLGCLTMIAMGLKDFIRFLAPTISPSTYSTLVLFANCVDSIVASWTIVDIIYFIRTRGSKRIGDYIAGTKVVRCESIE